MRKDWVWVGAISLALAGCAVTEQPQSSSPQATAYNGPVEEIGGAEPRYEPYKPANMQDYGMNGKTYHIVKNPENFSESGFATWHDRESVGNRTATGEEFDVNAMSAAHPTLPIPSYVRVTNLSNGRRLVVRINDRGPYTPGRIIDLTKGAADRLNLSNNTKVKVDFISVAPDGSLSGPGTIGTRVAKQSFALPSRPTLGSSGLGTPVMESAPATAAAARPISNATLTPAADNGGSNIVSGNPSVSNTGVSNGGGFLGAPKPLPSGVLEGSEPTSAAAPVRATAITPAVAAAPVAVQPSRTLSQPAVPAGAGNIVVQVGALSDQQRAQTWLKSLNERFRVPGKVTLNNGLYRIQLGPFQSRQHAADLQQRLSSEAQQPSFITTVSGAQ
ncbi:Endolytic peptidoglycan transglycosylase RlpA [Dickeya dianthicola]|uniref:Endolytic peptidoglycan transglycosylase RlpA n=12 Tax=Dickeya dianthicola TaxID=204039 RepID=A0AAP6VDW7_9GAMM|nr:endolytic peptidoglycan transglycosylase RlpA [Dickeya dianthicola]ATO32170.1 Rare lipoprotein A precursor [Dickeya dianthicola RNS04.9]AYC18169.1 Endolytic peptidoglycan transglycosylase RlpA [Dickeya dianthicola]MBI0437454.1 endolytic peptidoglycan transglycosylase RlpA [Dickeya dianthicola]MBI0465662.1 endolytic peptidoglycan transglycosylase RlpA [Dickeya dianthicola]MBI0478200.1 endolytic peptidoglycan transglycosylase RlpA [Dickeya dianthicola]